MLVFVVNGSSKPEYLASGYGVLFAAGGVWFDRLFSDDRLRWLAPVHVVVLVSGLVLVPVVLPILPVETYIRFAKALGVEPSTAESKELAELPQFYANMFGWEEKASAVANVYHRLSPEEQQRCVVFGDNYGRASALEFFAEKYQLPPAISNHNNYWLWGPGPSDGSIVIIIGGGYEDKREIFESVEIGGTVSTRYVMPYENNLRIYVCRNLKVPIQELWPSLKSYI